MLHESVHVSNYSINYYICQNILLFKVTTYDKKKSFYVKFPILDILHPNYLKSLYKIQCFWGICFKILFF